MSQAAKITDLLKEFYGTYRGFTPNDSPPLYMGELEFTITDSFITTKAATGQDILEDKMSTSQVKPLSKQDLEALLDPGNPYLQRAKGFDAGGMKLLFISDPKDDEYGLILFSGDEMIDRLVGPSILFTPDQLTRGLYTDAIADLEGKFGKDCFPRLSYGGKTSSDD